MVAMDVPYEIRKRVGTALTEANLQEWWNSSHKLLDDKSPKELWENGSGRERVIAFIESAKDVDMA